MTKRSPEMEGAYYVKWHNWTHIAIVFVHETFRFKVGLAGYNKQVQMKYGKLLSESDWHKYPIFPTTEGVDSILECTLIENPNFSDNDTLTNQIERSALEFIMDVKGFLSSCEF